MTIYHPLECNGCVTTCNSVEFKFHDCHRNVRYMPLNYNCTENVVTVRMHSTLTYVLYNFTYEITEITNISRGQTRLQ